MKIEVNMDDTKAEECADAKKETTAQAGDLTERYSPLVDYKEDVELMDDGTYPSTQEYIHRVKRTKRTLVTLAIMPPRNAISTGNDTTGVMEEARWTSINTVRISKGDAAEPRNTE